jgi:hypothetical protein
MGWLFDSSALLHQLLRLLIFGDCFGAGEKWKRSVGPIM